MNKNSHRKKLSGDILAFNILGYIVVITFALFCVVPFILVISGSFSSNSTIMINGYSLLPQDFSLEAYKMIFEIPKEIFNAYKVTIIITVIGTFLQLIICSMAGYVLSRRDFYFRNKFSFYFFFTTIFNAGLVPWYVLCVQYFHFKEHPYLALIIPGLFNYFYVIIFRSFMAEIPVSLAESAKIDGANDFSIFLRIILPLCKPVLATVGLFSALYYWNDWYNAMLFCTERVNYPLQYYLYTIINAANALSNISASAGITVQALPSETYKLAMTVVAAGPIVLVYPFVQRYFIKGMTVGAVKG